MPCFEYVQYIPNKVNLIEHKGNNLHTTQVLTVLNLSTQAHNLVSRAFFLLLLTSSPFPLSIVYCAREAVVLPDNGFGAPPAGMHHWQILNTTERWINGRTGEPKWRELGRDEEKGAEEGTGG